MNELIQTLKWLTDTYAIILNLFQTVEISLVEDSHSHLASPTNDSCISRESENYITHDAKNPVLTSFQQRIERKRKALGADEACTVLSLIAERMNSSRPEDEYDIIGKNIAAKLRRLPHSQSVYAEKLIYDVLFEAELGNLNKT